MAQTGNRQNNHSDKKKGKIRGRIIGIVGLAAAMLLGGAGGYAIAAWADANSGGNGSFLDVLLIIIITVLYIYIAFFLQVALHEAGHMICGLLTGYRFVSYRVGSFMWIRLDGKIRLKRFSLAGTGGQCLMGPPDMKDGKLPYALYNLGGALMNLIVSAVSVLLAYVLRGNWYLALFFGVVAAAGLWLAAVNGIPFKLAILNNDGRNILDIGRSGDEMYSFWVQMKENEQMARGIRVKDMPEEWFDIPDEEGVKCAMTAARRVTTVGRLMDEHKFVEAADLIDRLLETDSALIGLHRYLLIPERIYCELLGERRKEVLDQWKDKNLQKILKQMKNYPQILRVQYAYALIAENDREKAEKIRRQFEKVVQSYPYPGDAQSERELLEIAAAQLNCNPEIDTGNELC